MAFVTIGSSRYAVGAPAATGLFADIVTDLNFLNGVNTSSVDAGGAPLILNGSFESPLEASSTTPENWTIVAGDAGAAILINTDQNHGAQSLKFTRDTTAGHSGGTATTGFFNVSGGPSTNTGSAYALTFMMKSSATDVSSTVVINWFDASQGALSSTTVYFENSGTTSWKTRQFVVTPPATACFAKLVLSGGTSTTTPASTSTILFDGISMVARPPYLSSSDYTSSTSLTIPNGVFSVRFKVFGIGFTASSTRGGYSEKLYTCKPGDVATITISNASVGVNSVALNGVTIQATNGNSGSTAQGVGSGGTLNMTGFCSQTAAHIYAEY